MRALTARAIPRGLACSIAIGLSLATASTSNGQESLVVSTEAGSVRGTTRNNADVFLGLPYAAPPVGDLRWAPPAKAVAWQGVRDGSVPGSSCPQTGGTPLIPRSENEDCLYLNVYRPAGTNANASLPVMVYAYGGGNVSGGAIAFDGARMATENGIVVVVPNYRLGALGFLNHPALAKEAKDGQAGNYGVLDTKAALEWIQRNIAAFGGNPQKVTLASQSSGATNTCRLLVDPGTAGLFHASIIVSEDCIHDVDTVAESEARAATLATKLGCTDPANVATCLRSKSAGEIINAGGGWNPHAPKPAVEAIAAGEWRPVPVLLGSNREEGRGSGAAFRNFKPEDYTAWVTRLAGATRIPALLEAYPVDKYAGQHAIPYVIGDFITDSGMRGLGGCTNLTLAKRLARQAPTFYYQFEDPKPPAPLTPPGYEYRATHGFDVPYLWPDSADMTPASSRFTEDQRRLSNEMIRYWGAFVKNFNPAVPGQSAWPQFTGADGVMMALRPGGASQAIPAAQFYQQHQCGLWESMPLILDRGEI
jgi:para-nitrobenzyl esterase